MDLKSSKPSSSTTIMLTDFGRIALAAHSLAAAEKTHNEQRRKALCEQAMGYLRPVVQTQPERPSSTDDSGGV